MLKRLSTDQELEQYVGQFVPIKLDVSSEEYREFRKSQPKVASTIPRIYIVRSDGESMFAKSTSLPGEQLLTVLETCANHSGRILTEKEIVILREAKDEIARLSSRGNVSGAIAQIKKVRSIGSPGEFGSYAAPALEFDKEVIALLEKGRKALSPVTTAMEKPDALDEGKAISIVRNLFAVRERYGELGPLKSEISAHEKKISKHKNVGKIFKGVQLIERSYQVTGESGLRKMIEKVDALAQTREPGPMLEQLQQRAKSLRQRLAKLESEQADCR